MAVGLVDAPEATASDSAGAANDGSGDRYLIDTGAAPRCSLFSLISVLNGSGDVVSDLRLHFRRLTKRQIIKATITTKTPPITPPAIAPTGGEEVVLLLGGLVGSFAQDELSNGVVDAEVEVGIGSKSTLRKSQTWWNCSAMLRLTCIPRSQ